MSSFNATERMQAPRNQLALQLKLLAAKAIRLFNSDFCFEQCLQTPLHRQIELGPISFDAIDLPTLTSMVASGLHRSIKVLQRDLVGASMLASAHVLILLPARSYRLLSAQHALSTLTESLSQSVGFQIRVQPSAHVAEQHVQLRFGQSVGPISSQHRLLKFGHMTVSTAAATQPFYLDHLLLAELGSNVSPDTVLELYGEPDNYQLRGAPSITIVQQQGNSIMLTTSTNQRIELHVVTPVNSQSALVNSKPVAVLHDWQDSAEDRDDDDIGTYRGALAVNCSDDDDIGTYRGANPDDAEDDDIGTYRGPRDSTAPLAATTALRLRFAGLVAQGAYLQQMGFAVQPAGVRQQATAALQAMGITEVFQLDVPAESALPVSNGSIHLSRNALLAEQGKFYAMSGSFGLIDLLQVNLLAEQHLTLAQSAAMPGHWQVQLASDALHVYANEPTGDFTRLKNGEQISAFSGQQLIVGAMMFEVMA
ncbi:hypothetical protein [Rheinheimera sp. F8]|uniref:hypothetical protein n=1 Tax=Rheinheimera sp. F8 TaxID=1763998 RepID=UPI000744CBC2|nr:hypothetical protein [Rheinheimera sp. F8]ALZ76700.1 hypothetical protein ATY27_13660 [Rheinheimera sp. F8]